MRRHIMIRTFDAVILGAGAAGLMCAIEAGKRGRRVALLERADRIGKKILISGGGRCNFTNLYCAPENFLSANPHFCKSALARYTPSDFIALVEKYRILYHEKHKGQLFCDGSAREIVAMLEQECRAAGVEIVVGADVRELRKGAGDFRLRAGDSEYRSAKVVVSTGGLSIPKIGATAFGYELARQFGVNVIPCRPGLVPLTFNKKDLATYGDLAGVAADAVASCDSQQFHDKVLITHRGLSGPAILQISSYWRPGTEITIDLAPGSDLTAPLQKITGGRDLTAARNAFRAVLPQRFADRWIETHAPRDWTNRSLAELEDGAHHWQLVPAGTEGYEKAEVTAGGVDTDELSAKTMESREVPGLYFIGEVVDVTGQLGGFNFQWAWVSGYCAGQAV
jgi:predicted Rossmann fold flavoprotein